VVIDASPHASFDSPQNPHSTKINPYVDFKKSQSSLRDITDGNETVGQDFLKMENRAD